MSRGRAGLVVAFFALSLLWTLLTPWCTSDGASAADYVEAARAAAARAPDGALVLVHPPWRDDAVRALRAASVFPPGTAITTALSPRHGEPLPALLVLRDSAAPPLPRALRRHIDAEERHGAVRVAALQPVAEDDTRRDLSDWLAQAEVSVKREGSTQSCAWSPLAQRHLCEGMPEWVHVGVENLPVGGRTERCTWAHPVTGAALTVRFPHVRLLGALELELALTDGAADNAALAPVRAELLVDGTPAASLDTRPGQRGFVRTAVTTGAPRDASVELRFTTPNDGQRHTCFRLTTGSTP